MMPQLDDQTRDLLNKQLDRYGAITGRLSGHGAQTKTWCLTAIAALAALAVNNDQRAVLLVGIPLLITFLALDVFFLAVEQNFRDQAANLSRRAADDTLTWADLTEVRPVDTPLSWKRRLRALRS